jgi:hypothetical protein
VWLQLVVAELAGLDPQISQQIDEFVDWWDTRLLELLKDRVAPGRTSKELCDIIGVIVEGILLSSDREFASGLTAEELLSVTISPFLTS